MKRQLGHAPAVAAVVPLRVVEANHLRVMFAMILAMVLVTSAWQLTHTVSLRLRVVVAGYRPGRHAACGLRGGCQICKALAAPRDSRARKRHPAAPWVTQVHVGQCEVQSADQITPCVTDKLVWQRCGCGYGGCLRFGPSVLLPSRVVVCSYVCCSFHLYVSVQRG